MKDFWDKKVIETQDKNDYIKTEKNPINKKYVNEEENKQDFKFEEISKKEKKRTKPIYKEENGIFN